MIKQRFACISGKKFLILIGIGLLGSISSFAQDHSKLLGNVNIASPNAASLGKYGDIPVSYHTGVPNISIPIYTLSSGSLKMSVGLSYHAGGLRVEENDSWVGAGWSLNAGGTITRTVRDKPDERKTSSSQQYHGHFSDYGLNSYYMLNGQQPAVSVDGEPDLFSFSFNGYSGKFYFNDDRTPIFLPQQDFKIEYNYTPGQWNGSPGKWAGLDRCIEGFKITTPDGTKYYFGIPQQVVNNPYCDPIEVTSTYTSQEGTSYSQVISSWYLYKVESIDGAFTINLYYERDRYAFYTYVNNYNSNFNESVNRYTLVKNYVAGVRLSKISSTTGSIDFIPGTAREDLSGWNLADITGLTEYTNTGTKTLGGITISDVNGNCFKKMIFNYGYFTDNTTALSSYFNGWGIIYDKKRLKLNSVQEQNCNGLYTTPPYTFEYYSDAISRKLSFAKDHWGFNNGATGNTELYPALYNDNGVINADAGLPSTPANRDAVWPAMRAGTLNKITYPTGGYTNFDFEAHKFYVLETGVNVDKTIGGLRIKTITSYDPVAAKSTVTNYSYAGSNSLSTGILYSRPVYITHLRNTFLDITNYNPYSGGCFTSTQNAGVVENRTIIFSDNPLRPMETTQGYHIGYEMVKVSQTGNGASLYGFGIAPSWQINRDGVAVTKIDNPGACDMTANVPAVPLPIDFNRGDLIYESHFDEAGNKIIEKTFQTTYTESNITIPGRTTYIHGSTSLQSLYEIKTARKTQTTSIENLFQPGGSVLTTQTQTFYESNYHNQPTRIVTTDSRGQTVEKKTKYAFDYRVPIFENITNCYNGAASYMNYMNILLYTNGHAAEMASCNGYGNVSCYNEKVTNFLNALAGARKNYVDCRRTNYTDLYTPAYGSTPAIQLNTYQTNHNTAKNNADAELKPILWMQDIFVNAPIEVTEWKNGKLIGATFTQYSNTRDDEYGIYPEKVYNIELAAPSVTFSASAVSENHISITKDSRYKENSSFVFNSGNIINALGTDGVNVSYFWGYNNSQPVAKLTNAFNYSKDILQPAPLTKTYTGQLGPSNPSFGKQFVFYHNITGDISFTLNQPPPAAQVYGYYTLTGPNSFSQTGTLCFAGSGAANCSGVPSTITFNNMPAGYYTLSISCNTSFGSYTFNYNCSYGYNGMQIVNSGSKEFFVENFEENINAATGIAHTGNKYLNSNYTTSFTPPNSRSYKIQWWNLTGGQWVFNSQPYTNGMVLTGPVDDVRVFPVDAFITTYTYNAASDITSETDHRGRTLYYDYEQLGKLVLIRDNENNAIKKICYNYAGQVVNCSPTLSNVYFNTEQSQIFTRNNCPSGYTPSQVAYIVPANKYTSNINVQDANAKAIAEITANGQAYANAHGTCIQMFNVSGTNSKPKAYTVSFNGTNGTSGYYSFTLPIGANGVIGQVPAGTYNVSFSPQGSPIIATFNVNGYTQSGVQWATFYNISITGNTTVSVY